MTYREEESVNWKVIMTFACFTSFIYEVCTFYPILTIQSFRIGFEQHFYLFVRHHTLLQYLRCSQIGFTNDDIHLRSQRSQIECFTTGGITTTYDCYHFLAIEEPITGSTCTHTLTHIFLLVVQAQELRTCTSSDNHRIGFHFATVFKRKVIRSFAQVALHTDMFTNLHSEVIYLLAHQVHQVLSRQLLRMSWEILNDIGDGQLSTWLDTFIDNRSQIRSACINCCGIAGRTRAYNQTFNVFHGVFIILLFSYFSIFNLS